MPEQIQVAIPITLYKAAEEIVMQTENYKTPSEVVCHILKEFVPDYDQRVYSADEQNELKERLRSLGYLG